MLSTFGTKILNDLGIGIVTAYVVSFTILAASIIALTKDDHHRGSHIYSSQFNEPASLASLATPIKNLILNLDSEAHRFAINYYRSRHRKSFQK